MSTPRPVLRESHDDVRVAWVQSAARAIDAMHNNGWIAGVTEQMTSLMVGEGLRPNLKPDFAWAGWSERRSAEWARVAERRFAAWASNPWACDAGGRYTLAQMQAATVKSWFATGETVAQLPMIERPGVAWRTKLRLIPAYWLSQRTNEIERLVQGVYLDAAGAPAGYLFNPRRIDGYTHEIRRAARDAMGRPRIVHVFDGAIGQVRGITPFAPILRVLRNYDQLSDAVLTSEMIRAIFAATIESSYPSGEVLDALQSSDEQDDSASRFDAFMAEKLGWHENVDIDLGKHGKIAHLMAGEELKFHESGDAHSSYEAFANFLLREIARCAGAMFEDLTGDYRGATYSSVRMGIAKQWPLLLYRRRHVPVPISQAALEAFLEEEVDTGVLPMPGGMAGFLAHKHEVCRAEWRGPAKPQADEVKAARAHEVYRNMGVITDEQIVADLGADWEDVYQQRAFEKARREELGVHGGISAAGSDLDDLEATDEPANEQGAA